ncbi:MAG: transposase, partial [Nitrosomonas sp.]
MTVPKSEVIQKTSVSLGEVYGRDWKGGLNDESVDDMANSNLHVMRFLGLSLEDNVPDHSVLSRFRTRLTAAKVWNGLLNPINRQIQAYDINVKQGCYVDASITQSPRKPKIKPAYEVVGDREKRDDEKTRPRK